MYELLVTRINKLEGSQRGNDSGSEIIRHGAIQILYSQLRDVARELYNPNTTERVALGGLEAGVFELARLGFKTEALRLAENVILPLELEYLAAKPQTAESVSINSGQSANP